MIICRNEIVSLLCTIIFFCRSVILMAVELSFRHVFQDFNHSKVVVFSCLFSFLVLFALKEDRNLNWPYWATLIPLWIWKTLAVTGGVIGCIVFRIHPPNRNDSISHREYKAMILSFIQHFLLLIFELLVCFKLDFDNNLLWLFVFVPLLFQSLLAIPICVWSQKKGRNYEFEIIFAVNLLQFVFLALKLDAVLMWPWVVIFIPLWILICMSLIIVLYAIVSAILLIRSPDLMAEQRRTSVFSAINHTLLVVPILIFLVLLTNKLDGESQLPYLMVFTPLYVSLMCLIVMACGSKGGNQWWFGLRREFCQFLLSACPCLREYGNVSYRFSESSGGAAAAASLPASAPSSNGHAPANNQVSDAAASIRNKLDDQQQKIILMQNCSLDQPD